MEERDYVIPEDVKRVFSDVTALRMILDSRARYQEQSAKDILEEILKDTEKLCMENAAIKHALHNSSIVQKLISEDVETVNVTVPIERIITNTYTLDKKNITMQNLPDTLEAEILGASDTIDVDLTGIASVMNSVGVRSLTLKATVDWEKYMEEAELADLSAGTYRVTLTFALPDGVSVDRDITISVRLTDIEEE